MCVYVYIPPTFSSLFSALLVGTENECTFDLIDPRYNDKSINVLKDVFVGRSKLGNNLSKKIRLRGIYL